MIDQVPFLIEMLEDGLQEDYGILFGQFEQEFRDLGVEVVLVDHFVEVPHTVEKRFYDVGKDVLLLDGWRGQETLKLGEDVFHCGGD